MNNGGGSHAGVAVPGHAVSPNNTEIGQSGAAGAFNKAEVHNRRATVAGAKGNSESGHTPFVCYRLYNLGARLRRAVAGDDCKAGRPEVEAFRRFATGRHVHKEGLLFFGFSVIPQSQEGAAVEFGCSIVCGNEELKNGLHGCSSVAQIDKKL
ncbi:MAG: hypothetical protein OXU50_02680 [Gammaproteobacteria bacterium]|nr:hypothetical protein [Gammaproteobacteria bacterium]